MIDRQSTKLDDLLDRALAEYVAAEPRPELERRVLDYSRYHAVSGTAVWNRPLTRWLGAAAVMLVAMGTFRLEHRPQQILPVPHSREIGSVERAVPKPAIRTIQQVATVVPHRRPGKHVNRALPKRDLFPTPTPLSSEERALVAYAQHPPKELPTELTELGAPIKPVQIVAIQIRPLTQITPDKEN